MTGRLAGRAVIVTGASRGQGAVEAQLLAAEGAFVVVADVRDKEGQSVAAEIGERATFVHLDVRDAAAWETCVTHCTQVFGAPRALVNNAGILGTSTPLQELSEAAFREVIDINLVGAFLGSKAVVPAMAAAGGGSIINISSTAGFVGAPGLSAYTASKFALRGLTKASALELGRYGIRVNSIHPGSIDTAMIVRPPDSPSVRRQAIPRVGTTDEIARLVTFLISDDSSFCTGSEFVADGGFLAGIAWSGTGSPAA